jgi:hypothetical protein
MKELYSQVAELRRGESGEAAKRSGEINEREELGEYPTVFLAVSLDDGCHRGASMSVK